MVVSKLQENEPINPEDGQPSLKSPRATEQHYLRVDTVRAGQGQLAAHKKITGRLPMAPARDASARRSGQSLTAQLSLGLNCWLTLYLRSGCWDHSHELPCLAVTAVLRARRVGWFHRQNQQSLGVGLTHSKTGTRVRASHVAGPGRKSHEWLGKGPQAAS